MRTAEQQIVYVRDVPFEVFTTNRGMKYIWGYAGVSFKETAKIPIELCNVIGLRDTPEEEVKNNYSFSGEDMTDTNPSFS